MTEVDPTRCPLCGAGNACALAQPSIEGVDGGAPPACWCTRVVVDPERLAQLPAAARGRACLCPGCASGNHRQ